MTGPACTCRGAICRNDLGKQVVRLYLCPGCTRLVPWCFGAADDRPELCDDCWCEAHSKEAA